MKQAKASSGATGGASQNAGRGSFKAADAGNQAGNAAQNRFSAGQKRTSVEGKQDAIALLKADHRKVEDLFEDYEGAEDTAKKAELVKQICTELIIHTKIEEELFYPACRAAGVADDALDEAQVEHDGAKVMIADLAHGSPNDPFYDAKVKVLSEYIKHHVNEEEKPRSGIFAKAKSAKVDTAALGERMQARKSQLIAQKETLSASPLEARSLHLQDIHTTQENAQMARHTNQGGRDNQGRFSREENYGTGGRGYSLHGPSGGSRADYQGGDRADHGPDYDSQTGGYGSRNMSSRNPMSNDYDRSSGAYGNSMRGRDMDNRYMSDDSMRNRNQDSSSYQGQLRNQDWYGESEEASGGWQGRSGSRGNYNEDQDYSGSSSMGRGSSQYERGQGGQYSQSTYGQGRNQGGYSQNEGSQNNQGSRSRYSQDDFGSRGQQGAGDDYSSPRRQQNQGGGQGRGQQTSQNRYARDEEHQSYGSSSQHDSSEHDDDRSSRSMRPNRQYRE